MVEALQLCKGLTRLDLGILEFSEGAEDTDAALKDALTAMSALERLCCKNISQRPQGAAEAHRSARSTSRQRPALNSHDCLGGSAYRLTEEMGEGKKLTYKVQKNR